MGVSSLAGIFKETFLVEKRQSHILKVMKEHYIKSLWQFLLVNSTTYQAIIAFYNNPVNWSH